MRGVSLIMNILRVAVAKASIEMRAVLTGLDREEPRAAGYKSLAVLVQDSSSFVLFYYQLPDRSLRCKAGEHLSSPHMVYQRADMICYKNVNSVCTFAYRMS
jgi:hypothetical protein